jgi:hypothetical protein
MTVLKWILNRKAVEWITLAQVKGKDWAIVNKVTNIQVQAIWGI